MCGDRTLGVRGEPVHAPPSPYALLAPVLAECEQALKTAAGPSPETGLLTVYVGALREWRELISPELGELAAAHLAEIAALALRHRHRAGYRPAAERTGAVRLAAIKADIFVNLAHTDLSLHAVALRHGISPRYVQSLFKLEGATFRSYVLSLRLDQVRSLLLDPAHARRPIGEIAFACGFGDLSYFNHAFRRRFAMTPSAMRRQPSEDGQ